MSLTGTYHILLEADQLLPQSLPYPQDLHLDKQHPLVPELSPIFSVPLPVHFQEPTQ